MTEQRLLEEMLEGIRALRQSDTETKVKLEGIRVQLESMTSLRSDVEKMGRDVSDARGRIETLEELKLDERLKKVESTIFKIVAAALMLVGGLEFVSRLVNFWQGLSM